MPSDHINHRLRRAHQRANAVFQDAIGDSALTATQWSVLVTLSQQGSLSQNQLGRFTSMDPATTQGVIVRLAERTLVERRPDLRDRRRTCVTLTAQGQALVQRLLPNAVEAHARILSPLTPDEQAQFLGLLARLA
ncbi:DNA-binding MarR family transcriptional regulator [Azospirillum fermentarium]|uniref:MarR family winged helix-turn-helix transcriptional regulator n=1 Tax=Azospirillum fermentarium TaxID=1233114 RepID=UPI002227FC61|nr:MarR family transcriptional regulator [Azospirillum fermentarium]MCW2244600.1 DNA-binding MarR family transcriptional regulator [Azospirillum fermentarium]